MIFVQLKAKHFYLVANILSTFPADYSFRTLEKIKVGCEGLGDEDLTTIGVTTDELLSVFSILAQKPEGSYNNINTEMLDLLTPQVTTGVSLGNADWVFIGETITGVRTKNLQVVTEAIQRGKDFLYN
jgi:hypothetical protein